MIDFGSQLRQNSGLGIDNPANGAYSSISREASRRKFTKGDIVSVKSRTGPGENKQGGVARITNVHEDGKYDVKYVLSSMREKHLGKYDVKYVLSSMREKHLHESFISMYTDIAEDPLKSNYHGTPLQGDRALRRSKRSPANEVNTTPGSGGRARFSSRKSKSEKKRKGRCLEDRSVNGKDSSRSEKQKACLVSRKRKNRRVIIAKTSTSKERKIGSRQIKEVASTSTASSKKSNHRVKQSLPDLPSSLFGELVWKKWPSYGWYAGIIISERFNADVGKKAKMLTTVVRILWSNCDVTVEKESGLAKIVHSAHSYKKKPVIERQTLMLDAINSLEDHGIVRSIKAAWQSNSSLQSFSACCKWLSDQGLNKLKANVDEEISNVKATASGNLNQSSNSADKQKKGKTGLKIVSGKAADVKKRRDRKTKESYLKNTWLGELRPLWSHQTRMQCKSGLSAMLNELEDFESSCDEEEVEDGISIRASRNSYIHGSRSSSSSSSEDSLDSDDSDDDQRLDSSLGNTVLSLPFNFDYRLESTSEACLLACSDFRELCISEYPRAPPEEIVEYMFSRLLPSCRTLSQRNHVSSAITLAMELLPAGRASNCWRPKSWNDISNILDKISNSQNPISLGNHIESLRLIVHMFEQEQHCFNGAEENCGLTTLGFWMSNAKMCIDYDSNLPMLQVLVNKSVCLHHLAKTDETGNTTGFLLHRAWDLSRRLVNAMMWAVLHDASSSPSSSMPAKRPSKKSFNKGNDPRQDYDLRNLQINLAKSFWAGIDPDASGTPWNPEDGRGHLLTYRNRQEICSLLSRCREKFAPHMIRYCERRTKANARKAR